MSDDLSQRLARFVAELAAGGYLYGAEWRAAFADVPRHVFLPRFFISLPDGRWQAIDDSHPDYWDLVYADTTLTTQLDGALGPVPGMEPVSGTGTSSSTQPGLMAYMLDALQLNGSERILEIGTGTGYNAALLSHRLGADRVTSVEVDEHVAEAARERLKLCGYEPTVIHGDGERGWLDVAPYDGLIATCSIPTVPGDWIEQVRDGGRIVTSLWRDLGGGPLVRLTVDGATAQGFFLAEVGGFMPSRSVTRATAALSTAVNQDGVTRPALLGSGVLREPDVGMWLALLVPDVTWLGFTPTGGEEQLWLFASDGSWSMLQDHSMTVEQYGSRHLWDEIEATYRHWQDFGSPTRDRIGLTVTEDGTHRFWLDIPGQELWRDPPRIGQWQHNPHA